MYRAAALNKPDVKTPRAATRWIPVMTKAKKNINQASFGGSIFKAAKCASPSSAATHVIRRFLTCLKKVSFAKTGPFATFTAYTTFATFVSRRGWGICVGTGGSIGDDRWCRHHGTFLDASTLVCSLGLCVRVNILGGQRDSGNTLFQSVIFRAMYFGKCGFG